MNVTPFDPGLLAAVLAAPDDDLPRLICADWLDDHGEADRAEFIRLQIEYATDFDPHERTPRGNFLRKRCTLLLRWHGKHWFGTPGFASWTTSEWLRGFISGITCAAADWITNADAILAAQPVQHVALTTFPDIVPMSSTGGQSWYGLRGRMPGKLPLMPRPIPMPYPYMDGPEGFRDWVALKCLQSEWPGITFILPQASFTNYDGGSGDPDGIGPGGGGAAVSTNYDGGPLTSAGGVAGAADVNAGYGQ